MAKGFEKPGIVEWLVVMSTITNADRQRVAAENNLMVRNVEAERLPMDKDFGSFNTLVQAENAIPLEVRKTSLFIIRCPHRTNHDVQRKLFVSWQELVDFVQNLPGGFQQYRLGIREVSLPIWSGTIVCSKDGRILIEIWEGKHLEMDSGNAETSFRGLYDPLGIHFQWSDNCADEVKSVALGALRFLDRNLRPAEPIFAEFNLTMDGEYRFIGVSRDPFWTEQGF